MPIALGEDERLHERLRRRTFIIFTLLALGAVITVGRLWFLQVAKSDYYINLSQQNSIRIVSNEAPRGLILDRLRRKFVNNRPAYDVLVDTGNKSAYESLNSLMSLAGLTGHDITSNDHRMQGTRTMRVLSDIHLNVLSILEEHRLNLPGLEVVVRPKRRFLLPSLACHIIGYLGEATKSEIEESNGAIKLGDRAGRSGLEAVLDRTLRGTDGRHLVETNAIGRVIRTLRTAAETRPGNNVILTLDLQLQKAIERLFGAMAGAAVVMNPRTGEILALVSRPCFSLEAFENEVSSDEWHKLRNDPLAPMSNRCVSGQYPPGSTFKIFVALAALESGAVSPETEFECTGIMKLGNAKFRCWQRWGHGHIALREALKRSCNIYFYKAGLACGIGPISRIAREFGFGSPAGFSMPGEASGHIPSDAEGAKFWPGDVVSASIGQGTILVTPLQMAVAISALVNGGKVLRPYLVDRIESPDGDVLNRYGPKTNRTLSVSEQSIELIRSALFGVVNEEGGTARRARVDFPKLAGKTGTAQVAGRIGDEDIALEDTQYGLRPHSWFVGYAPADSPDIAFVVIIEHGGPGGKAAASLAGKIVRAAFSDVDKPEDNDMNQGEYRPDSKNDHPGQLPSQHNRLSSE